MKKKLLLKNTFFKLIFFIFLISITLFSLQFLKNNSSEENQREISEIDQSSENEKSLEELEDLMDLNLKNVLTFKSKEVGGINTRWHIALTVKSDDVDAFLQKNKILTTDENGVAISAFKHNEELEWWVSEKIVNYGVKNSSKFASYSVAITEASLDGTTTIYIDAWKT